MPFLRTCAAIAPTFLSLGNHEQALDTADLHAIMDTGVTVLDNDYVIHTIAGKRVVVGGLTSAYVTDYRHSTKHITRSSFNRYPKKEAIDGWDGLVNANSHQPDITWLEEYAAEPGFHILLSHHPEYFPIIPSSINLVLSGHAHGGQIRLYNPVKREWRGLFAPGQGFFPRWTKGVYENRLVVSAGLSNTAKVPRLFNPTEIVFIN